MTWATYYVIVGVIVAVGVGLRQWARAAAAHEASDKAWTDPEISKTLKVGHRYTSDQTYDQSKTTEQQRRQDAQARARRAKSAKTIKAIAAKPAKVTQLRRAK